MDVFSLQNSVSCTLMIRMYSFLYMLYFSNKFKKITWPWKQDLDQKANKNPQNPSAKNESPHFTEEQTECSGSPVNHQCANGPVRHGTHV